jgi:glutamate-5-semialdehyde dehydrogenase
LVDVLIPRGGKGLIRSVVENARVPVIETGAGNCHLYVDAAADLAKAVRVAVNAKCSRPSVCNAIETLLVHKTVAADFLPMMAEAMADYKVEFRGDEAACAILPAAVPATEEDWDTEYNDFILSARVVDSLDEAIAHIARYSTGHSEAIITESMAAANRFRNEVDAAAVYVNASTRFTDGGEFGFGAEIGISTQKLHARGPMGLYALTTDKYLVDGDGQVR